MGMIGSLVACLSLLGASTAGAAGAQKTFYVATSGSNSATGSSAAPLRTISAAISRAPSNGVIIVRSGSYHESLVLYGKSGLTIEAASGSSVYLDGSRAVTNWKKSGGNWVASGWTARFDSSPTFTAGAPDSTKPSWQFVNAAHPMAAHPDQIWIDGVAQKQVGSLSKVGAGSFYVDYGRSRLVVGTNPSGKHVAASDLAKAISIREPRVTMSGINVRKYAPSVPTMGAVTVERPGATLSHMRIIDNATSGLQVGASGARLTDMRFVRNGMIGLRAHNANGLLLRNVTATKNNVERFNPAPASGGAKITGSTGVRVKHSTFADNYGTGLWFDASNYKFAVSGSRFENNFTHGLFLEVSGTGTVANNVITHNAGNGLEINDTDHVQVWNNTFSANLKNIEIAQDSRDIHFTGSYHNAALPLPWRSQYITLRNNVLASPAAGGSCVLCVEDYSHRFSAAKLHISADGDVYQRPSQRRPQWLVVWSRGAGSPARYDTMKAVRSQTGQEKRGRLLNGTAALTTADRTTAAVTSLVASTAYAAPAWLATAAHVPTGSKHLGAWLR